jgi:hypothetical protein
MGRTPTVDPGQQLVDQFLGNLLVVKAGTRHVPRSHGTVKGHQSRDSVPPEVSRPKLARFMRDCRVLCSPAVRPWGLTPRWHRTCHG